MDKIRKLKSGKKRELSFLDIIVVTLIMFGYFIYTSTEALYYSFISTSNDEQLYKSVEFTSADDWNNLKTQLFLLVLAMLYLWIRNFDFSILKIRFKWYVLPLSIAIFGLVGLASDLSFTLLGTYNYFSLDVLSHIDWSFVELIRKVSGLYFSLIVYGLFNGFYEEFYFLGLLTSVKKSFRIPMFLFSLIVRFSFHTYQGLISALIIGFVIGILYYVLYRFKVKNLLPFFLAHAYADFFGTSLIYLVVVWS